MTQLFQTLQKVYKNVRLFIEGPRKYLYSWMVPLDIVEPLTPFNAESKKIGIELKRKIQKADPKLLVFFVGSLSLEIDGREDIDLIARSDAKDFQYHIQQLTPLIGPPTKIRSRFVDFNFFYKGLSVDLAIMDPRFFSYSLQLKTFILLKKFPKLREQYIAVKKQGVGKSGQEYNRNQMLFLNSIQKISIYSFPPKNKKV